MIKKILNRIKGDELMKGSLILFILINLFNLFNYVFHLIMARMLGPIDYGIFAVLMSFVLIYAIPSEAIQTVISKNTSKLNVRGEFGKMKDMLYMSLKSGAIASLIVFTAFTLLSFLFFSRILEINALLLTIGNLLIFAFFLIPVTRGLMQGRKKFSALGWTFFLESLLKISLGVLLVYAGFGVYGAITGVVATVIIIFLVSFLFLKEIITSKRKKADIKGMYFGNINIWLVMIAVFVFFSSDIIIAKAVFSPEMAGKYAVLSMIGKMIFYGTSGIGRAMFPISSQRFEEKKESSSVFKKSLLIVSILCLIAIVVMGLFPSLVVKILFGSIYADVSSALVYIALAFSLLSITNLILLYGISKNKINKRSSFPFIILFVLEIILLGMSGGSLVRFSLSFILVNLLVLGWSLYIVKRK